MILLSVMFLTNANTDDLTRNCIQAVGPNLRPNTPVQTTGWSKQVFQNNVYLLFLQHSSSSFSVPFAPSLTTQLAFPAAAA